MFHWLEADGKSRRPRPDAIATSFSIIPLGRRNDDLWGRALPSVETLRWGPSPLRGEQEPTPQRRPPNIAEGHPNSFGRRTPDSPPHAPRYPPSSILHPLSPLPTICCILTCISYRRSRYIASMQTSLPLANIAGYPSFLSTHSSDSGVLFNDPLDAIGPLRPLDRFTASHRAALVDAIEEDLRRWSAPATALDAAGWKRQAVTQGQGYVPPGKPAAGLVVLKGVEIQITESRQAEWGAAGKPGAMLLKALRHEGLTAFARQVPDDHESSSAIHIKIGVKP